MQVPTLTRSISSAVIGLLGLTLLAFAIGPRSWAQQTRSPRAGIQSKADKETTYSPEELASLTQRFQSEIWPLLTRKSSNCVGCHTPGNPSQLHFAGEPAAEFRSLLSSGHFDPENAASLLARVSAPNGPTRMPPPPLSAWTESEISKLRAFVNDLYSLRPKGERAEDEQFPASLAAPFGGKPPAAGMDNTFLTYYQLKGKIKVIFGDDWKREDHDLFQDNLAQFGGADFVRSYNESAHPTPAFLAGVDALSKDVVSRAYLNSTGPFAGRSTDLPSPAKMLAPDAAYRREINRLYRKMLFRDAAPQELASSFRLMQDIFRSQKDLAAQSYDLRFELTAADERGMTTTQNYNVHVVNDGYGLCQTLVNQNDTGGFDGKKMVQRKLDGPFTFKPGDASQKVVVSNIGTHGNVIVSGVEIRGPLPDGPSRTISISDSSVQAQGGWRLSSDGGIACYEDDNQNKGASSLTFPISVTQPGQYEITLDWRNSGTTQRPKGRRNYSGANADNVLVEVTSQDKSRLAWPVIPQKPPKGEAHFSLDQSDDSVAFRDLKTAFQFGPDDGVEITNAGTRQRVVADAIKFMEVPAGSSANSLAKADSFLVRAKEAKGQEEWKDYKKGQFTFYRPVGPRVVSDENAGDSKGKLRLFYQPSSHAEEWKSAAYYRVAVGYPGELINDTDVPIVVHARASSPILHTCYPLRAHVGAEITMDASGAYNLQGTPLHLNWRQVGGAHVKIADSHASRLSFTAPALPASQAAWEGLCRALMEHPDFLFTRPFALASIKDSQTRRRLQLVKIAQDLVGRTPTDAELAKLDKGASLSALIDGYLSSAEFKEFYFRRIRLYLESHGTEEDDEPARLWTWIMLNDRPFKEILTADYTVDTNWQRVARSAVHGKSGVLTMAGFIKGKPGLPHFNYPAQVCEKFLGYVFEVPAEIVKMREGITASSTTSPSSVCYSCHKILTPLAYQRTRWTDNGEYIAKEGDGKAIDDSDHQLVATYSFKGNGMEAFALQAQNKERFIRTMLQTHFIFYFGREMRFDRDERGLYKRLWDTEKANNYQIKGLIRALLTSPEYLGGTQAVPPQGAKKRRF